MAGRQQVKCSRGACKKVATQYCDRCRRFFCDACKDSHDSSVHQDEALEASVLSACLREIAKLKQPGARRVLKLMAKQVGLAYMPGIGKLHR